MLSTASTNTSFADSDPKQFYDSLKTAKLYLLSAILFGLYGGRVCPMLEQLSSTEIFTHVFVTFGSMWLVRHFLLADHSLLQEQKHGRLDTALFFLFSLPLAFYYNHQFQFPLDSNFKVLFGMTLFGFFTGQVLQIDSKLRSFKAILKADKFDCHLSGQRYSVVAYFMSMMALIVVVLISLFLMIASKDMFWLEQNPQTIIERTATLSVIKEFMYVAIVVAGYVLTILVLWGKLFKALLQQHEDKLQLVKDGETERRLPVFEANEFGSVASLTNAMLDSLEVSQQEVKTTRDVAIVSLAALAESRDNETGAHILRTQKYVRALAKHLAQKPAYQTLLTNDYIELLYKSAPLHDVGKVGIPDAILLKPGKLTVEEFEIMKQHPEIGANALSIAEKHLGTSSFLAVAKEISLSHHEKWDGSGYPKGLSGEDIPLSGRLMALADVYDALISKRVYKPAFSHDKAKSMILEGIGQHFDPQVVEAFIAIEDEFKDIANSYKDGE